MGDCFLFVKKGLPVIAVRRFIVLVFSSWFLVGSLVHAGESALIERSGRAQKTNKLRLVPFQKSVPKASAPNGNEHSIAPDAILELLLCAGDQNALGAFEYQYPPEVVYMHATRAARRFFESGQCINFAMIDWLAQQKVHAAYIGELEVRTEKKYSEWIDCLAAKGEKAVRELQRKEPLFLKLSTVNELAALWAKKNDVIASDEIIEWFEKNCIRSLKDVEAIRNNTENKISADYAMEYRWVFAFRNGDKNFIGTLLVSQPPKDISDEKKKEMVWRVCLGKEVPAKNTIRLLKKYGLQEFIPAGTRERIKKQRVDSWVTAVLDGNVTALDALKQNDAAFITSKNMQRVAQEVSAVNNVWLSDTVIEWLKNHKTPPSAIQDLHTVCSPERRIERWAQVVSSGKMDEIEKMISKDQSFVTPENMEKVALQVFWNPEVRPNRDVIQWLQRNGVDSDISPDRIFDRLTLISLHSARYGGNNSAQILHAITMSSPVCTENIKDISVQSEFCSNANYNRGGSNYPPSSPPLPSPLNSFDNNGCEA